MEGPGNSSSEAEISWAREAASFEVGFLWVYLASSEWKFSVALIWFRDCLIRRGCSHLLHRWRALRVTDAARRPWARLHLLPRDLRLQRSADGEVARALTCFSDWQGHLLFTLGQGTPFVFSPGCCNCGTSTERWCDSCRGFGRSRSEQVALCSECDGPTEEPCIHCLRFKRGDRWKW